MSSEYHRRNLAYPGHAKRIEENTTMGRSCDLRAPGAHGKTTLGHHKKQDITGGSSSGAVGNDAEMQPTNSGKRPLEPDGDDDMVSVLEVCDKLNESNAYAANGEGDSRDEMTGATCLRDMSGGNGLVRQVRSIRRGGRRYMPVKSGPHACFLSVETSTRVKLNVRKYVVD